MIMIPLPMAPPAVPAPTSATGAGPGASSASSASSAPGGDVPEGDLAETTPEQAEFAALLAAALSVPAPLAPVEVPVVIATGAPLVDAPLMEPASALPAVAPAPVAAAVEVEVEVAPAVPAGPVVVAEVPEGVAEAPEVPVEGELPVADVVPTAPKPPAPTEAPVVPVDVEVPHELDAPTDGETALAVAVEGELASEAPDAPVADAPDPISAPMAPAAADDDVPAVTAPTASARAAAAEPSAPAPEVEVAVDRAPAPAASQAGALRQPDAVVAQPTAPVARPVAPQPHAPIVSAVTPLLHRGDGSYHLSVTLHPAELGQVDVDVELRSGEINLRIVPANESGRDAIRAALPALRAELESAGVTAGTFDLGEQPPGEMPDGQRQPASPFARAALTAEPLPEPTNDIAADGAVDVRL